MSGGLTRSTRAAPVYSSLGDPAPTKVQKLAAADPLTELVRIAISASKGQPCRATATLFDGRQLYAIEFSAPEPRALSPRERSFGLETGLRCSLKFSEVAGFDAKPAQKRNQGLKGPLTIDFARVGVEGPWIISGVRGRTPLGDATIAVRALRIDGGEGSGLIALN